MFETISCGVYNIRLISLLFIYFAAYVTCHQQKENNRLHEIQDQREPQSLSLTILLFCDIQP